MKNWLFSVLLAINAITVGAQQVELGLTPTNNAVQVRMDWQAIPGQTYSVETTTNLASSNSWIKTSVIASNVLGAFEIESTNQAQFFRLVKKDTDAPAIISLTPQDGAVAVISNNPVTIVLNDETDIDTNSILFNIGPWTGVTLASPQVTWSSNTITFTPPDILGQAGGIVTNSLTVSDTLGHTLSNYTWTFQLARPAVAASAFLPLTAPSNSIQVLANGSTRLRTIPGIRPLDGTDSYHIVTVTSNALVFTYTGAIPVITNGTLLVSFDASYRFYRSVISNTINESQHQITAWTKDIPLTDLISQGSLSSVNFTSAQFIGGQKILWGTELNLLHVEFGDNLSGSVLYDNAGVKLHLPSGSWSFVGNVDAAFDIQGTTLTSLDASAAGKLTMNITPEALFYSLVNGDGECSLIPPVTRVFGAMAGPVPVWVEVTMELNAGYEYSAGASGSVRSTVSVAKDITFSVRLRDQRWTHDKINPPIVVEADPIVWQLEGSANARVYVKPKLTVLIFSLAGLWADIGPYAELDGRYQVNPVEYDLDFYLGLSATIGIESRVWFEDLWGEKPDWTYELVPRRTLWSDSYRTVSVQPTFVSTFPNRIVTLGQNLSLSAYAVGTPAPSYMWYFNGSRIANVTGPEYTISAAQLGHAGTYMVKAFSGAGEVQASCYVTVASGSGMILIPAGTNTGTDPDFGPYSLTVSSFHMDKYEVTKSKWDEVYNWAVSHGYSFNNSGSGKAANHPVQDVSWYDCVKWCNARSQMEGRVPAYYTSSSKSTVYKTGQINIADNCVNWISGYRLPTDVEWQYAARGGVSSKRFPWGAIIDHDKANYFGASSYFYDLGYAGYDTRYSATGSPYTSPVGAFEAGKNGYGLYDMVGNVWEWCWDWCPGYEGSYRVFRGGSFYIFASYCRVGYRDRYAPDYDDPGLGFRSVLPLGQ